MNIKLLKKIKKNWKIVKDLQMTGRFIGLYKGNPFEHASEYDKNVLILRIAYWEKFKYNEIFNTNLETLRSVHVLPKKREIRLKKLKSIWP